MAVLGNVMPWVKSQFFTSSGTIAAGYKLFVYIAGTSELATTFSDMEMNTANTNPVILDSAGRASIFVDRSKEYKFVLVDPLDTRDPQSSNLWSVDMIQPPWFWALDNVIDRDEVARPSWGRTFSLPSGATNPLTPQALNFPYQPTILYNEYVGGSTAPVVTIPAGTLDNMTGGVAASGDSLVLEWEVRYGSQTLAARSTIAGTDVDLGCGAASTHTRAKYMIYRADQNTLDVSTLVVQNTNRTVPNKTFECGHTQIAGLDLDANDYTIDAKMDGGTYTILGVRCYFGRGLPDWTGL